MSTHDKRYKSEEISPPENYDQSDFFNFSLKAIFYKHERGKIGVCCGNWSPGSSCPSDLTPQKTISFLVKVEFSWTKPAGLASFTGSLFFRGAYFLTFLLLTWPDAGSLLCQTWGLHRSMWPATHSTVGGILQLKLLPPPNFVRVICRDPDSVCYNLIWICREWSFHV